MRRGAFLLLLCAAGWGGPATGAGAFEEGLKAIRGLLERGQCAEGKKQLAKLLEDHARAPYALGRRAQVEDLMRQLVFGATVPQPEPKTVVSGELLQWNARDGTIKIRYTTYATMKDWVSHDGLYSLPAAFRGPHTITLKGSSYPEGGVTFFVCGNSKGALALVAGVKSRSPAYAVYVYRGDDEPVRYPDQYAPAVAGKPYELKVIVTEKEVKCCWLNKWFVRVSKEPDEWGSIALKGAAFDELLITGEIEPSWIQSLVDKKRQELIAEFDKHWQPKDDLPEWLLAATPAPTLARPDGRDLPSALDGDGAKTVQDVLEMYGRGEALIALAMVDAAPPGKLPDPVRDYLRGMLLDDLGRHEESVVACRKVREEDRDFVPAARVEAHALASLGRVDEAVAIYDDLLGRFPGGADLVADAALFLGSEGRWEEADRRIQGALGAGVGSERLDAASRVVHKALHGPAWPRPNDYASAHYLVLTDLDPKVCFEASQILEQAYALFVTRLERAPTTKERFKVFLFSGQAGYQDYVLQLLGTTAPHTAGLYAPALRQLFIWNLPRREQMMQTVRHEGFHQYLHRIMEDPPLWFNEGLAEYFEEAKVVNGKWTTGEPRRDHLQLLKTPRPLKDFLFLSDRDFMHDAFLDYAQAWAFLHFLLHTTRENRQLFDRFWDSFKKIPAHADAIRAALGDRTIDALDAEFRQHVAAMAEEK